LVCRDVQRQQASLALLRTLLEEVIDREVKPPLDPLA
ncbi:LysR family transcriptional regulator, partial [Bacillus cereus]